MLIIDELNSVFILFIKIWNIFSCVDDLLFQAMLNFSKYCEPLKKDGFADARQLWRNIEPQLKMCLSTVYLREVSSIKWEEMHQGNMEDYGMNYKLVYYQGFYTTAVFFFF